MTLQPPRKTEQEVLEYVAALVAEQKGQPCEPESILDFWATARGLCVVTPFAAILLVGHGENVMHMWEERLR